MGRWAEQKPLEQRIHFKNKPRMLKSTKINSRIVATKTDPNNHSPKMFKKEKQPLTILLALFAGPLWASHSSQRGLMGRAQGGVAFVFGMFSSKIVDVEGGLELHSSKPWTIQTSSPHDQKTTAQSLRRAEASQRFQANVLRQVPGRATSKNVGRKKFVTCWRLRYDSSMKGYCNVNELQVYSLCKFVLVLLEVSSSPFW